MIKTLGSTALALALTTTLGLLAAAPQALTSAARAQDTATTPAPVVPAVPELAIGNPDAKVTVTEYASYTCPHCAHFHEDVFKPLKADYIDTGKVRFIFREVYFDKYGLWASMIARCGGEMRYFGISGMMFETQKEWAAFSDATAVVDQLKTIGRAAGMDDATMEACLNDNDMAMAMVTAFQANMEADGIEGTPSLIINGTKYQNMSYAELKPILDAELAK
ncbi:DsbA family protein [Rhodobacter ferrooxidans]|uniref:Thiol-disulfide oxidoreductase D, putative n=1 Tax=Rhodobacter ferrooxidans TaxID=371731 RepID=C8RW70_9RHOB|nr:DsbA family protein [Rhodobacter sp. SW2]EEW26813.1 thiol-disulfide oxidoreductase D, putative [Rhodobacter sp. SW2]